MSVPYMPLFVADYEADTAHLSPEEDGIYMRLLRLCWRTPGCSIPDDPEWVTRMIRVTPEYYAERVVPIIAEFFRRRKARLFNPRLSEEFERIKVTSETRGNAARKRWRSRQAIEIGGKQVKPGICKTHAKRMHLEPEPEPDIKDATADSAYARDADPFDAILIAAGIDPTKDVTGKWHGSAQMCEADRWRTDLGLSQQEILAVLGDISSRRNGRGPPSTLSYFTPAMKVAAGRKTAPKLQPEGDQHDRRSPALDRIARAARRVSS